MFRSCQNLAQRTALRGADKVGSFLASRKEVQTNGMNPRFVLENALLLGNGFLAIDAYDALRQRPDELRQLPERVISEFLLQLAKGKFVFLGSYAFTQLAVGLRDDFIGNLDKNKPYPKLDALVIDSFQYTSPERAHVAIQHAIRFLEQSTPSGQTQLYNSIITLLSKFGLIDAAKELFALMKKADMDMTGSFEAICIGYAKNGLLKDAENLYNLMNDQELNPSSLCLIALLDGFAKVGDISKANKYFSLIPETENTSIRTRAFAGLIRVYSERGLPGETLRVYRQSREQGVSLAQNSFEYLIRAQLQNGDIAAAIRWFFKKENVGESKPSMGMYAALVEAYIERCDTVCAWKTLVEASVVYSWTSTVNKRSYVPLSVVRPFIYDLRHKNTADPSRLGDLKHIDYLRDRMNHVEFPEKGRGYIIGRMMTAALTEFKGRTADPTLALKLYEEYTSENGAAYNCRIPFISHIAAIKSYGLNGDMKSAQILFNRVIDESYDNELDAFIALIHGYSLNQQRERTLEVFEQMKKEGVELSVSIYEAVLAVAPDLAPELAIVINSSAIIPCLVKHPNVVKCLKDNGCDIIPKMLNPNK